MLHDGLGSNLLKKNEFQFEICNHQQYGFPYVYTPPYSVNIKYGIANDWEIGTAELNTSNLFLKHRMFSKNNFQTNFVSILDYFIVNQKYNYSNNKLKMFSSIFGLTTSFRHSNNLYSNFGIFNNYTNIKNVRVLSKKTSDIILLKLGLDYSIGKVSKTNKVNWFFNNLIFFSDLYLPINKTIINDNNLYTTKTREGMSRANYYVLAPQRVLQEFYKIGLQKK